MKKIIAIAGFFFAAMANGQTIFRLNQPPTFNNEYKKLWDKAKNLQLDVIGNNFYRKDSIGFSRAENGEGPNFYTDTWFPLDGMKRTFRATLLGYSEHKTTKLHDGYYDDDQEWEIQPDIEYRGIFDQGVREANRLDGAPASRNWQHFGCEIDLIDAQGEDYFSPHGQLYRNHYLKIGDKVCVYGPFVGDRGHSYTPEMHPLEQFWWQKKFTSYSTNYFLNAACDASERYDDTNNFDTNSGTYSPMVIWAPHPMHTSFAVAFSIPINNKNQRQYYSIRPASTYYAYNAKQPVVDGNSHHLMYNDDTLISIYEPNVNFIPDAISVSFDKLSLKGNSGADADTLIGFIVIRSDVGAGHSPGHVFLNMEKEDVATKSYRVIYESIKRLGYNSGTSYTRGATIPIEEKLIRLNLSKDRWNADNVQQFVIDNGEEIGLTDKTIFIDFPNINKPGETIAGFFFNFWKNNISNLVSVGSSIQKSVLLGKNQYAGTLTIRTNRSSASVARAIPTGGGTGGGGGTGTGNFDVFQIKYRIIEIINLKPNIN